ncbi:hypothetical protein GJ496_003162 [Pomphorhynchus laevis]|nr:hypothetical protein GJ496_003162 [Pomphorhynchus laevis]
MPSMGGHANEFVLGSVYEEISKWKPNQFNLPSELIAEARYLQSTRKRRECIQAQIDWKVAFRRSMQNGDTKAAIKSLEDASGGSYLNPDDFIGSSTVRQLLESKHPEGDRVYEEARSIFAGSEILVSHLGAEVLGCPIGYGDYERKWVEHKRRHGDFKSLRAGNPGMELV